MQRTVALTLTAALLAGCQHQPTDPRYLPSVTHGLETAGTGVAHFVLSPLMIAAGLLEGLAALPLLVGAGVHDLNRSMLDTHASASLDDTYRAAYGTPLANVPADGNTGVLYRRMDDATAQFRRVLRSLGVTDAERYLLTAVRTADHEGFTLYAVIRRDLPDARRASVAVLDKETRGRVRALQSGDLAWYTPHATTAAGQPLDTVIDWAAVPRDRIRTQRGQALLMTLAAQSVLGERRAPGYWHAESRWYAGEHHAVAGAARERLQARLAGAG